MEATTPLSVARVRKEHERNRPHYYAGRCGADVPSNVTYLRPMPDNRGSVPGVQSPIQLGGRLRFRLGFSRLTRTKNRLGCGVCRLLNLD